MGSVLVAVVFSLSPPSKHTHVHLRGGTKKKRHSSKVCIYQAIKRTIESPFRPVFGFSCRTAGPAFAIILLPILSAATRVILQIPRFPFSAYFCRLRSLTRFLLLLLLHLFRVLCSFLLLRVICFLRRRFLYCFSSFSSEVLTELRLPERVMIRNENETNRRKRKLISFPLPISVMTINIFTKKKRNSTNGLS